MFRGIRHRTPLARRWRLAAVVVAFAATLASAIALTASAETISLIDAVKAGDLATVRSLLAKEADVAAAEADGTTALHWAVENDNDALVAVLLEVGAKAQVVNRHGIAPLHRAATNGNASIIKRLLTAGADANVATPATTTAEIATSASFQPRGTDGVKTKAPLDALSVVGLSGFPWRSLTIIR